METCRLNSQYLRAEWVSSVKVIEGRRKALKLRDHSCGQHHGSLRHPKGVLEGLMLFQQKPVKVVLESSWDTEWVFFIPGFLGLSNWQDSRVDGSLCHLAGKKKNFSYPLRVAGSCWGKEDCIYFVFFPVFCQHKSAGDEQRNREDKTLADKLIRE